MPRTAAVTANVAATHTSASAVDLSMTKVGGECTQVGSILVSKTVLVDIMLDGCPGKSLRVYAILDEQSDSTLIDDAALDFFGKQFPSVTYDLVPADASNIIRTVGRQVKGLTVKGVLNNQILKLNDVLSLNKLTNSKAQVTTPEMALMHEHTAPYADKFPPFDSNARVALLIGIDNEKALNTQVPVPGVYPLLHCTSLGCALVGRACLPADHGAGAVRVVGACLTHSVEQAVTAAHVPRITDSDVTTTPARPLGTMNDVFERLPDDESLGTSHDDKVFLEHMQSNVKILPSGSIELPLPFKNDFVLPDNRSAIFMRSKNTITSIKRNPDKVAKCQLAMQKNIDNKFVEEVPQNDLYIDHDKRYYLPVFPVVQSKPHKEDKIRLVYDASAKYQGTSLNDVLLQGPDLTNNLRGVLLRFRERPVAFCGDIESMFNAFKVPSGQCDYLRFFWPHQNDFENDLAEYRALSHVFGCTSSPAVASFGLKYSVHDITFSELKSIRHYIMKAFYVDDGLYCTDTVDEAVQVLKGAVNRLKRHNIRLHKFISNEPEVLKAFPEADCSVSVASFKLQPSELQTTLGVAWSLETDSFTMNVTIPSKPFTKRGILSVINSIYDPINFVTPVILGGRLLQRKFLPTKDSNSPLYSLDWDDNIPAVHRPEWQAWLDSLQSLHNLSVPRCFIPKEFSVSVQDMHVFADASEDAIAYVAYLRSVATDGRVHVAFVSSAAKVAPRSAVSMPRLELCAALEAARAATSLTSELERKPSAVHFYSDSKVALGYIFNETRAFPKYIERRVSEIKCQAPASQWHYVNTHENPADIATRPIGPDTLLNSNWIKGPEFLWQTDFEPELYVNGPCGALMPEEIINVHVTSTQVTKTVHPFFEKNRTLNQLITLFSVILRFRYLVAKRKHERAGHDSGTAPVRCPDRAAAISLLVSTAQSDRYAHIRTLLQQNQHIPEIDPVGALNPRLDDQQLMRVGGRLRHSKLPVPHKHPYLIPKEHPLATAIINHFHAQVYHQGIHLTHGSIIQHGYFIEKGRTLIKNIIKNCVTCRKLRGPLAAQQMADLPPDRLACTPPFTHVGLDVFGPFMTTSGPRTRSSKVTKKLWALIIVCLPSRAIHLEPLDSLSTDSFRLALSRFVAIRGVCKTILSDQGTNFIGAKRQLTEIDIEKVSHELKKSNIEWSFNPPSASHFGGTWERKIGCVRKVLNGMFQLAGTTRMSREEFATVLAKAAAVVNDTPLWECPTAPEDPAPLTPSMLITGKDPGDPISADAIDDQAMADYGPRRHRRVEHLTNVFWKRWQNEYLHTLTKRHKWKHPKPCIAVDDVVLMRDKQVHRREWPMARVIGVTPGCDGLVRAVDLRLAPLHDKSANRFRSRPIHELVLLVPSNNHKCEVLPSTSPSLN